MCSFGGMERFLCIALIVFTNIALGKDIFKDLTFLDESDMHSDVTVINSSDMAHRLLDDLGKHLLSNDMHKNMLARILIHNKGSLKDVKQELEARLKPFADQSLELKAAIDAFIKKVLDTVQSFKANKNLDEDTIKAMLPTLHILTKQLIDQVTTTF